MFGTISHLQLLRNTGILHSQCSPRIYILVERVLGFFLLQVPIKVTWYSVLVAVAVSTGLYYFYSNIKQEDVISKWSRHPSPRLL